MPKKGAKKTAKNTKGSKTNNKTAKNNGMIKINLLTGYNNAGVKNAPWGNIENANAMGLKGKERKEFLERGLQLQKAANAREAARKKASDNRKKAARNYEESKKISPVWLPWWTPPSSNNEKTPSPKKMSLNNRKMAAAEKKAAVYVKNGELTKVKRQCKWHCKGHTCWAHTQGTCPYIHKKANGTWEANANASTTRRNSGRPPRPSRGHKRRNNTRKNY